MRSSPNNKDGKFQNQIETNMDMPLGTMLGTAWKMLAEGKKNEPDETIETVPFDAKQFLELGREDVVATWFGHSSVILNIHGKIFLIDPVFSERASMFSFMGPKRFKYTNYATFEDLPELDAVILSHDHYDHLDYETTLKLKEKNIKFYTAMGVGAHLEKWGISPANIVELDWWESLQFSDQITLISTPSRHFSGRGFTRNETFWCSWIFKGQQRQVFFGSDSGYFPGFKEIGEKFGPFDLTFLESGAYNKNWQAIHMMPEETVQAHQDLKGNVLLPIHWGKFNLALHHWKEPIERLLKKAGKMDVKVATPRIGEIIVLGRQLPQSKWWKEVN